jgi:hypothetical protein
VIIFFEEDSFDKNVQLAIKEAKRVRRALREEIVEPTPTRDPSQAEGQQRQLRRLHRMIDPGRPARLGRSDET